MTNDDDTSVGKRAKHILRDGRYFMSPVYEVSRSNETLELYLKIQRQTEGEAVTDRGFRR